MPQIFSRDRSCPLLYSISHLPIHVLDCSFAYQKCWQPLGSRRFEEEYSSVSLGSSPPYRSTVVGYGVLPAAVCPGSLEAFTHQAANIATALLRGTVFLALCRGGRMSWREDVVEGGCRGGRMSWREDVPHALDTQCSLWPG
jgi:hypothetical protein